MHNLVELVILFTSDSHGHLYPNPSINKEFSAQLKWCREPRQNVVGGFSYLAHVVENIRQKYPFVLLLDAGDAFSEVLNTLRETALSYPPKSLGWWEYSAEPFCKLTDVEQILQANPAIGYTTNLETIQEYIKTAKPEDARTEHLCLWVDAISSPWPYRAFEDLTVQDLQLNPGPTTVFGIDIAVTKKKASLVAAQLMPDGKIGG